MAGLIERLKRATQLPSPPGLAMQILRLARQGDVSLAEISQILSVDPALSLRALQYANSSLFGGSKETTTVREAVVLLGMRSVWTTALGFTLATPAERQACAGFDFDRFWSYSLARAVAVRFLARKGRQIAPEEAFAAGLLARVGQLLFAMAMPAEYAEILKHAGGMEGDTATFEQQRFGISHNRAAAELMHEWGIPGRLCTVLRYQCNPADPSLSVETSALARMINEAGPLVPAICESHSDLASASEMVRFMRVEYKELAPILSAPTDGIDVAQIQAEAEKALSEINLANQISGDEAEQPRHDAQEPASRDELTGVASRTAFDREVQKTWKHALAEGRPIGLVLLDVDRFQHFNSSHGYKAGDAVLSQIAQIIPVCCRSVDLVARFGADEFAVILPNADRLILAGICVKIRRVIEKRPFEFQGKSNKLTISLGAALLPIPSSLYTAQDLLQAAVHQLSRSKEKGQNCCSMIQLPARPASVLISA